MAWLVRSSRAILKWLNARNPNLNVKMASQELAIFVLSSRHNMNAREGFGLVCKRIDVFEQ